ncbi:MAG: phenylalanine--tRNA ligase subunit beta [Deltaproteobacteria bacterium]|nr:phenylalanine--tRNA ligase subunit beta [Deltaproteobacteria bacterium]
MRISYNWLGDYVDLSGVSPGDLADRLTMVGLELEELTDRYKYLNQVVSARITAITEVPGSDHLKICQVDTGAQIFQVVCGAPNTDIGMISALALVGGELPGGRAVGEVEIRGVRSQGMLCSAAELGLGQDSSGIIVLPPATALGQSLRSVLEIDDWAMELGVTPNRPDCLSVMGIAREVSGILGQPLKYPTIDLLESQEKTQNFTSVQILSPHHCPRYTARLIRNIKIGPSPYWLVDRLTATGVRSINNIVDVTNYVMMEMGQPLHAFDFNRLEEHRIVVRTADEGERFVTLDGVERILGPETLMICDGRQPVALAGIMGGLNSEIVPETTDVLLESAYFNPVSIRRTSKRLGLSTESSYRFERGIDPNLCIAAVDRAAALMAQLADGVVTGGIVDVHPLPPQKQTIPFSPAKCNTFLGTRHSSPEMIRILRGIELDVSGAEPVLTVNVPSFRVDLTREVDLFEEVARLAGFDRVPATLPPARAAAEPISPSRLMRAKCREILEGLGLSETITYSFIDADFCDRLGLPAEDPLRRTVRILNPLSEDQSLMRTTLAPGLLDTLRRNQSHGVWTVSVYEIGMVFERRDGQDLPEEHLIVAGLLAGRPDPVWYQPTRAFDFYDAKGVVEELGQGLNLFDLAFKPAGCPAYYDQNRSARILTGDRLLGWIGRLSPSVAKGFDLRESGGDPYLFELNLVQMLSAQRGAALFKPLPRFPYVERDLALVIDRNLESAEIIRFASGLGEPLLSEIFLFDAYEGRQIISGSKSLAFRLRYRSWDSTLTDEEVNSVHTRITQAVLSNFSAAMRE